MTKRTTKNKVVPVVAAMALALSGAALGVTQAQAQVEPTPTSDIRLGALTFTPNDGSPSISGSGIALESKTGTLSTYMASYYHPEYVKDVKVMTNVGEMTCALDRISGYYYGDPNWTDVPSATTCTLENVTIDASQESPQIIEATGYATREETGEAISTLDNSALIVTQAQKPIMTKTALPAQDVDQDGTIGVGDTVPYQIDVSFPNKISDHATYVTGILDEKMQDMQCEYTIPAPPDSEDPYLTRQGMPDRNTFFIEGQTITCRGTVPITEEDMNTCSSSNEASLNFNAYRIPVSKFAPEESLTINGTVTAYAVGDIPCNASVSIVKKINGDDANETPGVEVQKNSTMDITYEITNTGKRPLKNVIITDDKVPAEQITCPPIPRGAVDVTLPKFAPNPGDWDGLLLPGETNTCHATLPAPTEGGAQHTNIGTVTGTPYSEATLEEFDPVTDDDPANAYTVADPVPEPTPTPEPTPEPSETPTPEPTPEPSETPTPEPEPTPEPSETPTPTPEPSDTPTPTPEPSDTPTPVPSDEPKPDVTPEPTPSDEPKPDVTTGGDPTQDGFGGFALVISAIASATGAARLWRAKQERKS